MNSLAQFEFTNPLSNLFDVKNEIENLFYPLFLESTLPKRCKKYPAVDIIEDKDKYLVEVEVPGIKQENIDIVLRDNILTIKGKNEFAHKSDDDGLHRVERSYGSFTRSFNVPHEVKVDAITAACKDGVLNITLPKEEETKPKEIEIKVK